MSAISFLAGMGAGYLDQEDKKKQEARQDKQDARLAKQDARQEKVDAQTDERYQFEKDERQRAVDDRAALRTAAAPVPVVAEGGLPATMDSRDVGQPGEAPVAPNTFRVGAQSFASQGVATTAAGDQRKKNLSAALDVQDPAGAAARELQTLNITEAQRIAANRRWDDDLNAARSSTSPPDAIAKLMSDSRGDGLGGEFKAKAVYSADGKTFTIAKLNPDGSTTPTKMPQLPNNEGGWNLLQMQMSKAIPLEAKIAHYDHVRESDRDFKLRETDAAARRAHEARSAANDSARLGMERTRLAMTQAAHDAENKVPQAVKTQYATYDKELSTISTAIAKAQAEGTYDSASKSAQEMMVRQRELVAKSEALLKPYMGDKVAAVGGDPLGLFPKPGKPAAAAAPGAPLQGSTIAEIQQQLRGGAAPAASSKPAAMAAQGIAPATPAAPPPAATDHAAALKPLTDTVIAFASALAQAAQSGDPAAIQAYTDQLQQAKAARDTEAVRRLGQAGAAQYLSSVPQ